MSAKQIKGRPAGIVYFYLPWRGQKSVELGYWPGLPSSFLQRKIMHKSINKFRIFRFG